MMVETRVTIRLAGPNDARALEALAQLDSARHLLLPALVAEMDGDLRAALSLADSAVIADPFHPTSELVDLLQIRAHQLSAKPDAGPLSAIRALLGSVLPRATAA